MNCMNCGAFLADKDLDYCPHCGCNVLIQKKVEYLSKLYYNQGLEKASIRDLSGAVNCLKQSLTFYKRNIQTGLKFLKFLFVIDHKIPPQTPGKSTRNPMFSCRQFTFSTRVS